MKKGNNLVKIGKKKTIFVIGGLLLLFLGFLIGRASKSSLETLPGAVPRADFLSTTPVSSPSFEIIKVTRVIDGDTIELENGQRVRYIGIDTPETVDPRKPIQCFGVESAKKNRELVEGKTVRLEKDITDKDKYGRLLRYVYLGDLFVNLELVKEGFAHSYTYPPDVKYQAEILEAERQAREAKRGLWRACPLVSPTVSSPSVRGQTTTDCKIKGNINASGEKIYHFPDCGSYAKTKIDESRGERWFCSEEEAQAAGWRRALNCP